MRSRGIRGLLAGTCWAAAAATFVRGLRGTVRIRASLAWLAERPQELGQHADVRQVSDLHVVVLLPLLREQRLIAETVDYFRGLQQVYPRLSVVLVTTERERADRATAANRLDALAGALAAGRSPARLAHRYLGVLPRDRLTRLAQEVAGQPVPVCSAAVREAFAQLPPTDELAAKLAMQAQSEGVDLHHYHHPDPQAGMADQLNFAAAAELERLRVNGVDLRDCYLAIYNADSRPEPATFRVLNRTVADEEHVTGQRPEILQQSALFTHNLQKLDRGAQVAYLRGAALLQSRWSLAHEIPTLRRQAASAVPGLRGVRRLGHCTGHGLFVRADAYHAWHGLPTATMNEDLTFGFLLSAAGRPIHPLPALEYADSPETFGQVMRQKRQWFWSYVEYPRAARLAADLNLGTPWARATLVAQGLSRGGAWLATSPVMAATIVLPIIQRRPEAFAAAAAALGVYFIVPFHLITADFQHRGRHAGRPDAGTLAGGLAAYLTHSIGPWWCCADALRRLTGARYTHDKTER